MPDKSFGELVREAPEASGTGTVSLVGVLGRSHDPRKFVLTLADGRVVTLDVDAVRDHQVLSGATGQIVVRVGLDASHLPQELIPNPHVSLKQLLNSPHTGWQDQVHTGSTNFWLDQPLPIPQLPPNTPPPIVPFSLAVPQALQAASWLRWPHPPKIIADGSYPFGPMPDF